MAKKFQIFISSTFRDLIDERQDTIRSVLDLGHIPSGMEIFPAADVQQFEYIRKVIDECDYYILIIGARYGSVDAEGVSFTEKEYAYAVEKGLPVLAFIHGDVQSLPVSRSDTDPAIVERLNRFRIKVGEGRLVRFWKTREELKAQVIISLAKATNDFPAVGWIRGDAVASETLLTQINGLRNQNDELKVALEKLKQAEKPIFDDIADFDSSFPLRIETYNPNGDDHKQKREMTWRTIFRAVGPDLESPKWAASLSTSLKAYLNENAGFSRRVTSIFDSDIETIRLQLAAYGLISAFVSNKQGGGTALAVQLTPLGRRRLAEISVIRKEAAAENGQQ